MLVTGAAELSWLQDPSQVTWNALGEVLEVCTLDVEAGSARELDSVHSEYSELSHFGTHSRCRI